MTKAALNLRSLIRAFSACVTIFLSGVAGQFSCNAEELLVSDLATSRVLAYPYDPTTGLTTGSPRVLVGNDSGTNGGLLVPAAMTIGFGGDLFVASQASGHVLRYDIATGALKQTSGNAFFAQNLLGPAGLLYDVNAGRMFVSTLGASDSTIIKVYDSVGAEIGQIDAGPAAGRTGMVLHPATGDLLVNSFNETGLDPTAGEDGAVLRFHASSGFTTFDTLIAGDGDFQNSPMVVAGMNGLAFDGSSLYAASMFGQQVIKMDVDGNVQGVFGSAMPPTAYPSGVLIDANGDLLVSTLGNNNASDPLYPFQFPGTVQKFSSTGDFLGELNVHGDALNTAPGSTFIPTSLLISPVPEPTGYLLLAFGIVVMAVKRLNHR